MPGTAPAPALTRRPVFWITVVAALVVIVVGAVVIIRALTRSPTVDAANRSIGAGVLVSGPEVPRDVKATATQAATPFKLVTPLGPVFDLTPSGSLPAKMTVKFPLNRPVADARNVLLGRADDTRRVWTLLRPTLTPDHRYVEVNIGRLSLFRPLMVNVAAASAAFKREVDKDINAVSGNPLAAVQKPICPNGNAALGEGYSVRAIGRGALYWCFGVENGRRVLRVVNHRRYPLELSYAGASLLHAPKASLGIARKANEAAADQLVLFPVGHAAFAVSLPVTGGQAVVNADISGLSEGLYALELGVTTLVNTLSRFGVLSEVFAGQKLSQSQYNEIVTYMARFLRHEPCANAVRSHHGQNIQRIVDTCFSKTLVTEVFGEKGLLLATFLTEKPPSTLFRREVRAVRGEATGSGVHRIVINRVSPLQLMAGRYGIRNGSLVIQPAGDGLATWNVGYCAQPTPGAPPPEKCMFYGALSFTSVPGGLLGRYTSVTYRQADGGAVPRGFVPPMGAPQPGDSSGEIKYVTTGVATNNEFGNPYLCRTDAPATWQVRCSQY